jgi:hypothetical protein
MKKALLLTICICFMKGTVFAGDVLKKHEQWFIDSYEYGKRGSECSDIYFNYGTDKWTLNEDDPTLLKEFHEACKAGENDKMTGQNNLPQLLDDFRNKRE